MNPSVCPFGIRLVSALNSVNGPRIERIAGTPQGTLDRPAASLALDTSNRTLWINTSDPSGTAWVPVGGVELGNTFDLVLPAPSILANDTTDIYWSAPFPGAVISGIDLVGAALTTAGTATLAVATGAAFADNVLAAATADLTALTAGANTALGLTGSASILALNANQQVRFRVVSNNADLAGGLAGVRVSYYLQP